jgi:hypothetical protein
MFFVGRDCCLVQSHIEISGHFFFFVILKLGSNYGTFVISVASFIDYTYRDMILPSMDHSGICCCHCDLSQGQSNEIPPFCLFVGVYLTKSRVTLHNEKRASISSRLMFKTRPYMGQHVLPTSGAGLQLPVCVCSQ